MTTSFKQWVCMHCGYVYDEADGDPDHGYPPGTRFVDLPDSWSCPDCTSTKADFIPLD